MHLFRKVNIRFVAVFGCLAGALMWSITTYAAQNKKFVIVLDAGHGGKDFGATENGVNEKDVNLAVSLKLGELIKKNLKDTEVIYTRSDDHFVSLQGRANIANNAKADFFVSIHCNSADRNNKNRSTIQGATTYILGQSKETEHLDVVKRENEVVEKDASDKALFASFNATEDVSHIIYDISYTQNRRNSARLAKDIQKSMQEAGRFSRGVQEAGFWVLWSTAMPSVLVELDFICNPDQAKFMGSTAGQDKLAGAIFQAVKKYESYYRQNLGSHNASSESMLQLAQNNINGESSQTQKSESLTKTEQKLIAQKDGVSTRQRTRRSHASKEDKEPEGTTAIEIGQTEKNNESQQLAQNDNSSMKASGSTKPSRGRKGASQKRAQKQTMRNVYKVLLFSSDREYKAGDKAFKNLKGVTFFVENDIYNYTYGESDDEETIRRILEEIRDDFPEAKIIERIS